MSFIDRLSVQLEVRGGTYYRRSVHLYFTEDLEQRGGVEG
jgi:hypothetical protein